MENDGDVCLIIEGGYPYLLGGVSSWADAMIRASPGVRFHIIAISIAIQPRIPKFQAPSNLIGVTDVLLDVCADGRRAGANDGRAIADAIALMQAAMTAGKGHEFAELIDHCATTGFGKSALLDSKPAWKDLERVYEELLPHGSLIDFFWSWRFLARSLLAIISTPLPDVRVFHAVSTGYAGLLGAFAKHKTKRPLIVTEHGIYTNERRIELSVADWIFDSGAGGFGAGDRPTELRDLWLGAFENFSRLAYEFSDVITTQYRANQTYQRLDGAPDAKLRIIPNGIDVDQYRSIIQSREPRPPTVLMIGRIVPIKDTRTFIMAISVLKGMIPDVQAILIGPEDDDPSYALGCRELVKQLGLDTTVQFLGRVPDVDDYLGLCDVIALTSISEAQPIALLEAAATGLPAVTTDVGSCREVLEGFAGDPIIGRGGIVVGACDPIATAQALASILLDPEMKARMGDVMRRRVGNLYHKDRIRQLYVSLYDEVASRPLSTIRGSGPWPG